MKSTKFSFFFPISEFLKSAFRPKLHVARWSFLGSEADFLKITFLILNSNN